MNVDGVRKHTLCQLWHVIEIVYEPAAGNCSTDSTTQESTVHESATYHGEEKQEDDNGRDQCRDDAKD